MSKIYYTVNVAAQGYPVRYIDRAGQTQYMNLECKDAGQACQEFEIKVPGACYLNWKDFAKREREIAADRAKLLAWKEWAV